MFTVTDARATTEDTYNAIHNALDKALGDDTTEFEEGVYAEFRARIEAFTQIPGNNFTENMRSKMTRLESKINKLIAPQSTSNTTTPNVSPSAAAISSINIDENATGPSLEQQETLRQKQEAARVREAVTQKQTEVSGVITTALSLEKDAVDLGALKEAFLALPVMKDVHADDQAAAETIRNTCYHHLYDLANKHHLELTFEETELSALGVTATAQTTTWQAEVEAERVRVEQEVNRIRVKAEEKQSAFAHHITELLASDIDKTVVDLGALKEDFLALPAMTDVHTGDRESAKELRNICYERLYNLANKHHLELVIEESDCTRLGVTATAQTTTWQAEVEAERVRVEQEAVRVREAATQKQTEVSDVITAALSLEKDVVDLGALKEAFLALPAMTDVHTDDQAAAETIRNTCYHHLYDLANKHHLELVIEETELSALGVTAEPQTTTWQAEVAAAEEEKIRQNVIAAQGKFQAATDDLTQEQDKDEPDEVRVKQLKDAVQQAELELDVAKSALTDLEQQKQAAEEEAQRLAAEKAAIEKAATEKEAADKLAADKKVAEKQAAEQEVARKLAAEKAAADKKVARADEFKKKIMPKLVEFSDKLKDKLEDKAHKGKAVEIQHLIDKMLQPLYGEPSQENLDTFKKELEQLLLKEKDAFKATPWIWHDVIRPALMGFLGVVVTLVTAIARPFSTTVSNFANSFFAKPDSPAFKILKSESEELVQSMGNVISTPAG
ncbi:MAG: hypothetical protein P1U61_04855 [Legionellaceae bacterium]|nr:hypothetical protein [Legionellaceae bacterium]